ncbi:glycoside-pentoside-hexuronide (GPH):cation symporter [Ruminococcaceae bacterium OttesenSCG-928-D13]|nr:glycoside-pentoside-hexuronide (GPH):cation symporter [Ruminococcaceae bacterium OttesenSCG-928-D13]
MGKNSAAGTVGLRTRLSYGLGCIGRDANYTLVSNFILTYLTLAVGVSNWQLGAVGVVMVIARVWDAVNDPMMGTIIDNTNTRFGKFKPFILAGALLNSVFTVLLFSNPAQGEVTFIVVFAITYILWGMTYTMNDIAYWGMLPSLTTNHAEREKVTSLARIGANLGLFSVTALVPILTAGGMGSMYRPIAIVVAAVFIACQVLVVAGVQEPKRGITQVKNNTTLKDMVRIIGKNDQLLVIAVAILLFNIGYFTTTGFGVQFFYFDYGVFGGPEFTIFAASLGVAQILTLSIFPSLAKGIKRRGQFTIGIVMVVIGYLALFAVGYLFPMNMPILCVIGFVLFAGQAIVQLLNYVLLADTVEYGQWKLGTRNDSIIYSLNPFITKLASAVQAGIFSATLIISNLNTVSNEISGLENQMNQLGEGTEAVRDGIIAEGNRIVQQIPDSSTFILRVSMIVLPLLLILACYIIYMKKFKIDEKMYEKIVSDLEERAAAQAKEAPND